MKWKKTEEIFFKGDNPNNYVKFEVGTEWSETDTNLFRILSIYDNKIKIVYNTPLDGWTRADAFSNTYNSEDSKKKVLYDSIVNKNYLSLESYKQEYFCRGTTSSSTGRHNYNCTLSNNKTTDYIASITNHELLNTLSNNSSWLPDDYIALTYSYSSGERYERDGILSVTEVERVNFHVGYSVDEYLPLITLNSNVKIVKDSNCNNSGTKECPYLLECSSC